MYAWFLIAVDVSGTERSNIYSGAQGIEDSSTGRDSPGFPWTAGSCRSGKMSPPAWALAFLSILSVSELINPNEGWEIVIFHLPQEQAELLSDSVWSRKNWTGLCVLSSFHGVLKLFCFPLRLQLQCARAGVLVGQYSEWLPCSPGFQTFLFPSLTSAFFPEFLLCGQSILCSVMTVVSVGMTESLMTLMQTVTSGGYFAFIYLFTYDKQVTNSIGHFFLFMQSVLLLHCPPTSISAGDFKLSLAFIETEKTEHPLLLLLAFRPFGKGGFCCGEERSSLHPLCVWGDSRASTSGTEHVWWEECACRMSSCWWSVDICPYLPHRQREPHAKSFFLLSLRMLLIHFSYWVCWEPDLHLGFEIWSDYDRQPRDPKKYLHKKSWKQNLGLRIEFACIIPLLVS